jgi:tetratricopeptide (TPR) repeat protein
LREWNRKQEAESLLLKEVEVDPENAFVRQALIDLYCEQGKWQQARQLAVEGLYRYQRNNLGFLLVAGTVAMRNFRYRKAIRYFRKILSLSPKGVSTDLALMRAAECVHRLGYPTRAAEIYQLIVSWFPRSELKRECRYYASRIRTAKSISSPVMIPFYRPLMQKREFCAPAVLERLLIFHGIRKSQQEIAAAIFSDGVPNYAAREYCLSQGLNAVSTVVEQKLLISLIKHGIPVIVDEYHGCEGHMVAVVGVDEAKGAFVVYDPNYPDLVEIPFPEFDRSRRPNSHWGLVVYPQRMDTGRPELLPSWRRAREMQLLMEMKEEADREASEGRFGRARRLYERVIRADPSFEAAARGLVELEIRSKRMAAAALACAEMIARFAKSYWVWRYLGDAMFSLGRWQEAESAYRRAARMYSEDHHLYAFLGETYAAKYRMLQMSPSEGAEKKRTRERIQSRARQFRLRALRNFHRAVELEPRFVWAHKRLAAFYFDLGQEAKAAYHVGFARELENP